MMDIIEMATTGTTESIATKTERAITIKEMGVIIATRIGKAATGTEETGEMETGTTDMIINNKHPHHLNNSFYN